uniref:Transmembrane protein n=1 Tax=Panagrellus redivivus TaxID=6233 RepID=A0A7E4VAF1_PANRE
MAPSQMVSLNGAAVADNVYQPVVQREAFEMQMEDDPDANSIIVQERPSLGAKLTVTLISSVVICLCLVKLFYYN